MSNELLTLFAILVYAIYRTTNDLRDNCEVSREIVHDMLEEFSKTAARGNNKSGGTVLYCTKQCMGVTPLALPVSIQPLHCNPPYLIAI